MKKKDTTLAQTPNPATPAQAKVVLREMERTVMSMARTGARSEDPLVAALAAGLVVEQRRMRHVHDRFLSVLRELKSAERRKQPPPRAKFDEATVALLANSKRVLSIVEALTNREQEIAPPEALPEPALHKQLGE